MNASSNDEPIDQPGEGPANGAPILPAAQDRGAAPDQPPQPDRSHSPDLSQNIVRRALGAIFSNRGDTFWIYLLAIGAAFGAGFLVAAWWPGDVLFNPGREDAIVFYPTLASAIVFLAPAIRRPGFVIELDPVTRSFGLALLTVAALLGVKWLLKVEFVGGGAQTYSWMFVVAVAVIAPVAEECFFRGYLWRVYEERGYDPKAILLAVSLLFWAAHFPTSPPVQLEYAFMSLSLGLIRYFSGGVYLGIVAHSLMNLIVLYAH